MKHFHNDNYAALIIGAAGGLLLQPILTNVIAGIRIELRVIIFLACLLGTPVAFAILNTIVPPYKRFLKFFLVGCLNTAVDLGILNFMFQVFGQDKAYDFPLYATLGFFGATLNSYFWNQHWTFDDSDARGFRSVAWFYGVSVVGFFVNVGISSGLVLWGIPPGLTLVLWENIAKGLGIIFSMITNFLGYKYLVFRRPMQKV